MPRLLKETRGRMVVIRAPPMGVPFVAMTRRSVGAAEALVPETWRQRTTVRASADGLVGVKTPLLCFRGFIVQGLWNLARGLQSRKSGNSKAFGLG